MATSPEQQKINAEFMDSIRAKTIAELESQDARGKAIKVLLETLEATDIKPFNDKGEIIYSKALVAHGHRLKAVELIASLLGLKAPEKHELVVDTLEDKLRELHQRRMESKAK